MDALNDLAQLPWPEIVIFVLSVVFLFAAFKIIVLDDDRESFVHLRVPAPEQCSPAWKGEVLREPTVKVPYPWTLLQVC